VSDAFIALVAAHFICDYPLQGDTVAREKNPHSTSALQKHVPWYYWMTAHAATHGLAAALITHSSVIGIAEFAAHFACDWLKCRGRVSIHIDQSFHLACKAAWAVLT